MYKHDHMVRAGLWSEDDWLFTVRDAAICQAPSALKQAPITARLLFNGLSPILFYCLFIFITHSVDFITATHLLPTTVSAQGLTVMGLALLFRYLIIMNE